MATKYTVITPAGAKLGPRARKDGAIKLGEESGEAFTVVTDSGQVVYTSPDVTEAPAPTTEENIVSDTTIAQDLAELDDVVGAAKKAPAKKTAAKKAAAAKPEQAPAEPEGPSMELEFEGLGKYYAKCAGLHGAEVIGKVFGVAASIKGTTITLHGEEEDTEAVANHLLALWPAAKLAHREYRKNDKVYSEIDKSRKNTEANAQRWELEVAWFLAFMDGAADELAGTAKRKGGAYRDGVTAIQNPAGDADDDVI